MPISSPLASAKSAMLALPVPRSDSCITLTQTQEASIGPPTVATPPLRHHRMGRANCFPPPAESARQLRALSAVPERGERQASRRCRHRAPVALHRHEVRRPGGHPRQTPAAEPVAQSELCGTARVGEARAWVQQGLRNALPAAADEQNGTYGARKACWAASRILYKCALCDLSRPGQQI